METFVLTAHIVICIFLVVLVLLQSGKEGMGVIFGGGGSSLFGSSGAGGVLAKLTAFVAVGFLVTSLTYNVMTTERTPTKSVMDSITIEESAPAAVETPAPAAMEETSSALPSATSTPNGEAAPAETIAEVAEQAAEASVVEANSEVSAEATAAASAEGSVATEQTEQTEPSQPAPAPVQ